MIKTILLDIEGTTTPIDFVHKVLFPFAKERLHEFVSTRFGDLEGPINDLRVEHSRADDPVDVFPANSPEAVSDYLKYLIDLDRKSTILKTIQGEIWRRGYETRLLKSEVFDDVPRAFARWNAAGKTIAIYSSGSILAQQLLFRHTLSGDLTPFISDYFDTNVGAKRDKASYVKISEEIGMPAKFILFVSDIPAELTAARDAGLSILLSIRPGNMPVESIEAWPAITTFDQID